MDFTALDLALQSALEDIAQPYGEALRAANEAIVYEWPRQTFRSNGQLVGSPRNIVDTGAHRDSQSLEIGDGELVFTWNTPYSAEIYTGTQDRPPRRWDQVAQDSFNIEQEYANALEKRV
jgi:hypothetical protein